MNDVPGDDSIIDLVCDGLELEGDAREAYIARATDGDTSLARRVHQLIAAHEAVEVAAPEPPAEGRAEGRLIGPYRIERQLGEGGMGAVYLAEQHEPIRRRVAIKVIKLGMDTRQVIARFDAERQTLAMMDHPGVAKVLDAGADDDGRPYFVMEYVDGTPITDYCERHTLDTRARLRLFVRVCDAIQHAHHQGVIHRDIKPSNVLVVRHGDEPAPKVIDFGIAKATDKGLDSKTLLTEDGQLVGTPEYMSPEQAALSGATADTRTDVYALGVLLYEMLTGSVPLRTRLARERGLDELQRVIREEIPDKPSTRVERSTAADTPSRDRAVARELRGDIDVITMKALEKDRARRYGTASELAADVQRYLDQRPIIARPPSRSYRARRFFARHRVFMISAAAVAIALTAGVVGTTWKWIEASRTADVMSWMSRDLESAFGMLLTVTDSRGYPLSEEDLAAIESGVARIDARDWTPDAELKVRQAYAQLYFYGGAHEQAAQQWTRVRTLQEQVDAPMDRQLWVESVLVECMIRTDRLVEANERLTRVIAAVENDPSSAARHLRFVHSKALVMIRLDRLDDARTTLDRALELFDTMEPRPGVRKNPTDRLDILAARARVLRLEGQFVEAEREINAVIAGRVAFNAETNRKPQEDWGWLAARREHALVMRDTGRPVEARRELTTIIDIITTHFGPDDSRVGSYREALDSIAP